LRDLLEKKVVKKTPLIALTLRQCLYGERLAEELAYSVSKFFFSATSAQNEKKKIRQL
jgi:hypothetical protein